MKGVDALSKYYSIHEFSKIIGVSAQTLRNWDANGKLHPHHTTVSGYRYYSDEQLNQVIIAIWFWADRIYRFTL